MIAQMYDPGALVIVLAGTLIATAARCGARDLGVAGAALAALGRTRFDEDANRVALARTAHEVEQRGKLCAAVAMPPDASLARLIDAYVRHGSLDAMHQQAGSDRATREAARAVAVRTFEYAGELAPVFGLVGTLFGITRLVPGAGDTIETTMAAIATAVLSTLYGVLTAHLLCIPLARAIERRGEREEEARERLVDWLAPHLGTATPIALRPMRGVA
ncbi:MotA/TolQ/ExbB proton channel family protein [Erythrobacter sp. JK5]|uniref:MotA/TolQ/ExbB proton channel family protein n=1 Tax=Erythrobacter sp. JK5 TaxID=2829500 RepID=UPI001BADA6DB|nr:MotA/TolQ/ExbB proton channel family protein [Erythrobacter sp. JK5]QUL36929.1 MotA/TolQ/ExbB proton channel family protein [Erythrobacter sp. JK5]